MAKKLSQTPKPGHNGYDGEKLKVYLDRIDNIQGDIDNTMDEAKGSCAPKRQDMNDVKEEACDRCGVTKSVLAAVIRERRLSNKVLDIRTKLNDDHKESFDQVRHALGGLAALPLGQAVLNEQPALAKAA